MVKMTNELIFRCFAVFVNRYSAMRKQHEIDTVMPREPKLVVALLAHHRDQLNMRLNLKRETAFG